MYQFARRDARLRSRRQRRKAMAVNGIVVVLAMVVAVGGAYVGWQVYVDTNDESDVTVDSKTPRELIDILEEEPAWNGPGVPAFGVGETP